MLSVNGTWSSILVAGKTVEVYDPSEGRPRFTVLHLHDAGSTTLRGQGAYTSLFDRHQLACVCPIAGPCWWVDRICPDFDAKVSPEQFLLGSVLPLIRERWGFDLRAIALLGMSMGGQGVLRLGFKHPQLFPVVAALAPLVEYHEFYGQGTVLDEIYDSKEQCRQDTAPMHIQPGHTPPHLFFCMGPDDPWLRGCERLAEKLSALGVEFEADLKTPGGHSWDYFDQMAGRAVGFLVAGLEQEARRLL
jgi:S-formylglutathione hydrolase